MTSSILRKSDRDLTIAGVGHVTLMSYGSVLEINTGNSPSAPSTGQVVASPLFLALLVSDRRARVLAAAASSGSAKVPKSPRSVSITSLGSRRVARAKAVR
jgi:hypothetical protein